MTFSFLCFPHWPSTNKTIKASIPFFCYNYTSFFNSLSFSMKKTKKFPHTFSLVAGLCVCMTCGLWRTQTAQQYQLNWRGVALVPHPQAQIWWIMRPGLHRNFGKLEAKSTSFFSTLGLIISSCSTWILLIWATSILSWVAPWTVRNYLVGVKTCAVYVKEGLKILGTSKIGVSAFLGSIYISTESFAWS